MHFPFHSFSLLQKCTTTKASSVRRSFFFLSLATVSLVLLPASSPVLNLLAALFDLALQVGHLLSLLPLLLLGLLRGNNGLALRLAHELLGTTLGNVTGVEVGEAPLEDTLDNVAEAKVENHGCSHLRFEFLGEGDELHALVDLGDELEGADKSEAGHAENAVVHALVLGEGLAEGAALVVDGECGDLLDKLEEVDGRVEERGGELGLEVDIITRAPRTMTVSKQVYGQTGSQEK